MEERKIDFRLAEENGGAPEAPLPPREKPTKRKKKSY